MSEITLFFNVIGLSAMGIALMCSLENYLKTAALSGFWLGMTIVTGAVFFWSGLVTLEATQLIGEISTAIHASIGATSTIGLFRACTAVTKKALLYIV